VVVDYNLKRTSGLGYRPYMVPLASRLVFVDMPIFRDVKNVV
jgi:hypothetical protein